MSEQQHPLKELAEEYISKAKWGQTPTDWEITLVNGNIRGFAGWASRRIEPQTQALIKELEQALEQQALFLSTHRICQLEQVEAERDALKAQLEEALEVLEKLNNAAIHQSSVYHDSYHVLIEELTTPFMTQDNTALLETRRLERERALCMSQIAKAEDNEATAFPWWAITEGFRGREILLAGPYFNREDADEYLEAKRYNFGEKARVYCFSGSQSHVWRAALKAAQELQEGGK